MQRYLLSRVLQAVAILLGVLLLVFLMVHATGDPATLMMPREASPQDIQAFRHAMVRGKSKLRLNRGMAAIAELRLCLAQQALGDPPVLLGNSRRAEKLRLRERRLHFVADPGGLGQV